MELMPELKSESQPNTKKWVAGKINHLKEQNYVLFQCVSVERICTCHIFCPSVTLYKNSYNSVDFQARSSRFCMVVDLHNTNISCHKIPNHTKQIQIIPYHESMHISHFTSQKLEIVYTKYSNHLQPHNKKTIFRSVQLKYFSSIEALVMQMSVHPLGSFCFFSINLGPPDCSWKQIHAKFGARNN